MDNIIPVAIFVICLFLIQSAYYAIANLRKSESRKVRQRLKSIQEGAYSIDEPLDIRRKRRLSDVPWLGRALLHVPGIQRLDNLLVQANVDFPVSLLLLSPFLLALTGYWLGSHFFTNFFVVLLAPPIMGYLPFFFVRIKKRNRMAKFGEQLPDALELVARTLRAGHAFTVGMKMVSDEFDDPMGTEFRRTLDEINFGVSVADALKSMAKRVDCPDLKFFVVAVIIQRDTGGNLAEIIDSMARIIRERFKLKGRIQVLSAEGKFSAIVLCSLPFLMALVISFINPKFMMILNDDPIGRVFVWIAIILMICGIFFMRRMIQIRV